MENSRIILVHGFTNNPTDFDLWRIILEEEQLNSNTIPFSKKETVYEPISKYSQALSDFLANVKDEKLILIGYSMGGLVIRYYLQNLLEKYHSISQVITVATPHNGTNYATLGIIGGFIGDIISQKLREKPMLEKAITDTSVAQLSPYSPFIKKLNKITPKIAKIYNKIDCLNIWLQNDSVIIPSGNAISPLKRTINREISSDISHNMVLKKRGANELLLEEITPVLKKQKRRRRRGPQSMDDWKRREYKKKPMRRN